MQSICWTDQNKSECVSPQCRLYPSHVQNPGKEMKIILSHLALQLADWSSEQSLQLDANAEAPSFSMILKTPPWSALLYSVLCQNIATWHVSDVWQFVDYTVANYWQLVKTLLNIACMSDSYNRHRLMTDINVAHCILHYTRIPVPYILQIRFHNYIKYF